MMDMAWRSRSD